MTHARAYFLALIALLCFASTPIAAQSGCVSPGDILEVRTPGFLSRETPNLVIIFARTENRVPVRAISVTKSRLRIQMPSVGLLPNTRFKVRHLENGGKTKVVANARTCEFQTGGGGSDGESDGSFADKNTNAGRVPFQRATRFQVAAPSGAAEYVLMGAASEVSQAEATVLQAGGRILRRRSLPGLRLAMAMVDLQNGLTLSSLRSDLSRRNIDVSAGAHQVYRISQGEPNAFARKLTLGSEIATCKLRRPVRIGLIDGPVNVRHPALHSVRIETISVLDNRDRPASSDHATGISGLIAAQKFGLAQGAHILSVTAVTRVGTREIAKLENIAAALDRLVSRKVDIINMSLAGPSNAALSRAIATTARRGIIMVASVGNDRRSPVAYPASDPNVIAVTAIDQDKRLYRHASQGSNVDFAAPGVDLRVPSGRKGSAFRSGTSYASAALTAIIAIELSKNGGNRNSIRRLLSARAEDLGSAGPDPKFGFGLAQSSGC